MRKVNLALTAPVLCCLLLLLSGVSCRSNNDAGKSSVVPYTGHILFSDRVNLNARDSTVAWDTDIPGSFNDNGYYLSPRFFLDTGETIQVWLTANAPIYLADTSRLETVSVLITGLNAISEEDQPSGDIPVDYFTLETAATSPGVWQLVYTFPALRNPAGNYQIPGGYYQLNILNNLGRSASCEYTVVLTKTK